MIALIRPILFTFIQSRGCRKLVVDLLEALAKRTDNDLDDQAVAIVREKLL